MGPGAEYYGSMSILVAGGAGYIGAHVVRLLLGRGEKVVVVDDLSYGSPSRVTGAELVQLDVASGQATEALTDLMKSHNVTAVIHGNLAHRALKRMIPNDYPYVVRVVSDILESNGSSSMATVCAGTLALRDAGVPLKKPVSRIAIELISKNKETN